MSDFAGTRVALAVIGDELKAASAGDAVAYAYGIGRQALGWQDDSAGRLFDLASLTKPLFTAPAVLLRTAGRLPLDAPVGDALPWLPPGSSQLTARQLLTHSAGLPAELPLELPAGDEDARIGFGRWLSSQPGHDARPGELVSYSDPGYWLLGQLLTELTSETLHEIFAQLPTAAPGEFAFGSAPQDAAVNCGPRSNNVQLPHDPAAQRLGISGHAGTFGTLTGVTAAVLSWLATDWLAALLTAEARTCQTHSLPGGHRSLAWTLAGDPYHCVAHDWPTTTLCHTGASGVSVALDPVSGWWGVYLSNAVAIDHDARPVLKARRLFHARVAEHLHSHAATVRRAVRQNTKEPAHG